MAARRPTLNFCVFLLLGALCGAASADAIPPLRVGIIGLDTSHCVAFTKILNDPKADGDLVGLKVVAGFPGGSPDVENSASRVEGFVQQLREMDVEIVDTIPALLAKVDVVLLESVDGRPHLAQARAVFEAGKPVYIDKPLAGTLADAIALDALGKKYNCPWFSSSSLRFVDEVQKARHSSKSPIEGCMTWGPAHLEPHHPDLFWYGVHGVEMLFTLMGPDCESVSRTHTDGADVVVGIWKGGRIGSFRGLRDGSGYGFVTFDKKTGAAVTVKANYDPMLQQIGKFFRTHEPPVTHEETLTILAFMEAADESKRAGGKPVRIDEVMRAARTRDVK